MFQVTLHEGISESMQALQETGHGFAGKIDSSGGTIKIAPAGAGDTFYGFIEKTDQNGVLSPSLTTSGISADEYVTVRHGGMQVVTDKVIGTLSAGDNIYLSSTIDGFLESSVSGTSIGFVNEYTSGTNVAVITIYGDTNLPR